ncbi:hypothetical protein VP01_2634g1 [Puccinia sorghi]|uniref:Uncharacterized protein n=1 Tax=Puccinia sorghi TaxID=27349 RepID=A0A0L6V4Z6_9BASI|nr:hypothetical protein VP01_2634g1 [Puccinia sorghi]
MATTHYGHLAVAAGRSVTQSLHITHPHLISLTKHGQNCLKQLRLTTQDSMLLKCSKRLIKMWQFHHPPQKQICHLCSRSHEPLLYNSAHQIAALTKFTELDSTPAYAYLKIDPEMTQDYKKELNENGKVSQEASKKRISKNRERVYTRLLLFADFFALLTLIFTSSSQGTNITTFLFYTSSRNAVERFWNQSLHTVMKSLWKGKESTKSRTYLIAPRTPNPLQTSCRQIRKLPKKPDISTFKLAPKGLAIDFYNPKWYHKPFPVQKKSIPNQNALAFLPNAKESLLPKAERPDEKLADSTFTKIYWEVLAEQYGLVGPGSSAEESASGDGDRDEEGDGINLTQPSPNASKDKFLEEGKTGSLYDDKEDNEFISLDFEEEEKGDGSDDEEDDKYDKAQDNIVMKTIPEGEEECLLERSPTSRPTTKPLNNPKPAPSSVTKYSPESCLNRSSANQAASSWAGRQLP